MKKKQNIIMLILLIWLIMGGCNVYALLIHQVKTFDIFHYCGIEDHSDIQPLILSFFICAYLIPLCIICFLYCFIIAHLNRATKYVTLSNKSNSNTRNAQVAKAVLVIILCFMLGWAPMHVQNMVALYGQLPQGPVYEVFRILWHCLAYLNSCCNPILYNYMCQDFRKAFREICCCIPTPVQSPRLSITPSFRVRHHTGPNRRTSSARSNSDSDLTKITSV